LAPSDSTAHLRSIMVPVDGSHASMEAVGLACDIARKNKGKVYVVHVIEVKRTLALDAAMDVEETAGDEVLAAAEGVAKGHGYEAEGEILHAREASSAIVDEAIERAVDLIIMGIEYQQPVGEFVLGKAVESVLKNAACEVWVLRHAVEATA